MHTVIENYEFIILTAHINVYLTSWLVNNYVQSR